jgi:hypothetical protein
VGAEPRGALLHLGLDAKGLAAGRRPGRPPIFRAAALTVASTTPETRLSRLFTTARDLKAVPRPPITLPLASDFNAAGVRLEAAGSRASLSATLDRAAGRIDLAGLLSRQIDLDGLRGDGVDLRLLTQARPPGGKPASPHWTARVTGLHLTHLRQIALDDFLLAAAGDARDAGADAAFSYGRDGTLTVPRISVAMPAGRFGIAGATVAEPLSVQAEARIDPTVLGGNAGKRFLRAVSGTAGVRARISSLGFLHPFLRKAPWLIPQAQGELSADARLDHGRLQPGTRLAMEASALQVRIFDSLASGRGGVHVTVEGGGGTPRTALRIHLDRFRLADLRQPGRPAYLRGSGLQVAAVAPAALDLAAGMPDFDATLDLPDAEVPDLTVYNSLLPEEAGFSIVSGEGRARLHLEASTATRRATGSVALTSAAARVRFQNLEIAGRLDLRAPLVSPDLDGRRFDLAGTRLELSQVSYRNLEARSDAEVAGWWARAELTGGSVVWGTPLALRGEGKLDMQSSGPLLALFAERSRFLRWFNDALMVENVSARGVVRLGGGQVQIESLQATGGALEVRSRMIFAKTRRSGDLYLRYGRLAAGIELRDGRRSLKLRQPLAWYESRPRL